MEAVPMFFLTALVVPLAVSVGLHVWFRRLVGGRAYWLAAVGAAAFVATLRIGFVALGGYLLEHSSGWLQLPGYAMALCGLPEALLMPRPRSAGTLGRLAGLLVAGSAAWVFAIAIAARARQRS